MGNTKGHNMKSYKDFITEGLGTSDYTDISDAINNSSIKAYIPHSRSAMHILSVPEGERGNRNALNTKVKWDKGMVIIRAKDGGLYYLKKNDNNSFDIFDRTGREIYRLPYPVVDVKKLYKAVK